MSKLNIQRSVTINSSADKIYNILSDFNEWRAWSPWLIQEPEAVVKVAEDTKSYTWEGKRVGSGAMRILTEKVNEFIDYDLIFLKPYKSKAKTSFELNAKGAESTEVIWRMDSPWPFFLFWMKKTMTNLIGMDYERGLNMLKDYAEDGKVHSELLFQGESDYPGCTYIGINADTTQATFKQQMSSDFEKLINFMSDKMELLETAGISIYHKWDMGKDRINYTAALPVKSVPDNLPTGVKVGNIPATKVYTVAHKGDYEHLGNAWSTLMSMQRNKDFKQNKKIPPFELYVNTPNETPKSELLTEIKFAVK